MCESEEGVLSGDFAKTEGRRWAMEKIKPIAEELAAKQRDLREAEAATLTTPIAESAAEVRATLTDVLTHWEQLTPDRRREVVATFVDYVGVLAPDQTGAVVVEFAWNPKVVLTDMGEPLVDILVMYKPRTRDCRPWEAWEDEALMRLWPAASGVTRQEIQAALLPNRRYNAIVIHLPQLGIKNPKRSRAWRVAWMEAEKEWGSQNPDVLYLHIDGFSSAISFLNAMTTLWAERDQWKNHSITGRIERTVPVGAAANVSAEADLIPAPENKFGRHQELGGEEDRLLRSGSTQKFDQWKNAQVERVTISNEVIRDVARLFHDTMQTAQTSTGANHTAPTGGDQGAPNTEKSSAESTNSPLTASQSVMEGNAVSSQ